MIYYSKEKKELIIPSGFNPETGGSGRYDEGYSDGVEAQKALITPLTVTTNGTYENENGYNPVVVNTPEPKLGYHTFTANGLQFKASSYGLDGFDVVDVQVPTSLDEMNLYAEFYLTFENDTVLPSDLYQSLTFLWEGLDLAFTHFLSSKAPVYQNTLFDVCTQGMTIPAGRYKMVTALLVRGQWESSISNRIPFKWIGVNGKVNGLTASDPEYVKFYSI